MAGKNGISREGFKLLALAMVIMVALVAGCGKSDDESRPVAASGTPAPPAAATVTAPPPAAANADQSAAPAPLKALSVVELLKQAGTALGESRYVQPPGNNAAEYYLAILDKDSNNNAARDGLREMFPMATGAIEQQINAGQLDEGKRSIDLMGRADANNYALTILRGKLDLKRKQMDGEKDKLQRDQERTLAAAKAAAAAAAPVTAATAAPPPAATAAQTTAATTPVPSVVQPAAPAPAPVAAAPAAAPVATPPVVVADTRGATLVNRINPVYPSDAARNHQEGWVEVSFVVGADGKVRDASVVNATPARIFNAAALRAVQRWTFQPRIENGKPAEQTVRTRIEFRL